MSLSAWEAVSLNAQMPKEREVLEDPRFMTDHELRWALREGIAVIGQGTSPQGGELELAPLIRRMYRHLGLDEMTTQACYHLGVAPWMEEE